MICEERKDCVSCGAGDNLELTGVLQRSKGFNEIAIGTEIEVANGFEPLKIESRQFVEMLFPMCTMDFPFGQIDQSFEMPQVTLLQQGIQEHRAKRWRKRESQAYLHSILAPALQNLQQWN